MPKNQYTERQQREIDYHREHARRVAKRAAVTTFDVVTSKKRRPHNGYWHLYTKLLEEPLEGKRVLVIGCGAGHDALRLAKMGASVYAFDLSPEMLELGRQAALREGLDIQFDAMPAEQLDYEDDFFDYAVAVGILHHVDIPPAMREIVRVARDGCKFFIDEIYSHSLTEKVRKSKLIDQHLYPKLVNWVYKGKKPYITEDERKLHENDVEEIGGHFSSVVYRRYFSFIVTRLIPDKWSPVSRLDYYVLRATGGLGKYLAGRILMIGVISKPAAAEPQQGGADTA